MRQQLNQHFSTLPRQIIKNNKIIIQGYQTDNVLWETIFSPSSLPLPTTSSTLRHHHASTIIGQTKKKKGSIQYYAVSLFNPRTSTLRFGIPNNFLTTWSGLTTKKLSKHLPHSEAAAKSYMDQENNNLQPMSSYEPLQQDIDISPLQVENNAKTNKMMCIIIFFVRI